MANPGHSYLTDAYSNCVFRFPKYLLIFQCPASSAKAPEPYFEVIFIEIGDIKPY